MQPVSFFAITAVMFVVVMALVFVLMRGEYKRKDTMPKLLTVYLAPAGGVSVIRADQVGAENADPSNIASAETPSQTLFRLTVKLALATLN